MSLISLIHADVINSGNIITDASIIVKDGIIDFVGPFENAHKIGKDQVIDCQGKSAVPGLIDLQINGIKGFDFSNCLDDEDQIPDLVKEITSTGTTSFLATIISSPLEEMEKSISVLSKFIQKNYLKGIMGLHIEGPFLNPDCSGAHLGKNILRPSVEILERLLKAGGGEIKFITLAPELPGAGDIIEYLKSVGVIVSIGHSSADGKTCKEAISLGAACFTHLFNAMGPIHQRAPGPSIAGLVEDRAYVTIIGDGIHLDPDIVRLISRTKDPDKLILVSDLAPIAGMEEGEVHKFAGQEVIIKDGVGRVYKDGKTGGLAGSARVLLDGLKSFIEITGWPLEKAIQTVTINPAKLLGVDDKLGSIEKGKNADIIVLDDVLRPVDSFKNGEVISIT